MQEGLFKQLLSSRYEIKYVFWRFLFIDTATGGARFSLDTTLPGYFNRVHLFDLKRLGYRTEVYHLNPLQIVRVLWHIKRQGKMPKFFED